MATQTLFRQIEKRVKITRGKRPSVVLSLPDWEIIEDIILELSSPKLLREIQLARQDYKKGAGVEYRLV